MTEISTVLITGGAGYVGSSLVPKLLKEGYHVKVLDLFLYGEDLFDEFQDNPYLTLIQGDIRDQELLRTSLAGCDAVIHLACISNDPSFELDKELGKSINLDAFEPLVDIAKSSGVRRFIYASSSSVYGIKKEKNVTEELELEPLTDYSLYKAQCEEILLKKREEGFVTLVIRPATVCGYAPRLRLDVCVNILTCHAYHTGKMKVFGGEQLRPNLHIEDMTELYLQSLRWPDGKIDGKVFNVGYENYSVRNIGHIVESAVGQHVETVVTPSDDLRSYHISSEKIREELGFEPRHSIEDAVEGLIEAFKSGKVPEAMDNKRYYNIKMMQAVHLK
ncbi:MAG: UDP-glucose 4-epimerase [Waddliaceae bacterium]|nr:UDP-glucose 4-epimerase [Waddliaceae bacterium]